MTAASAKAPLSVVNIDKQSWFWKNDSEIELLEYNALRPPRIVWDLGVHVTACRIQKKVCSVQNGIDIVLPQVAARSTSMTLEYSIGQGPPKTLKISALRRLSADFKIQGRSRLKRNIVFGPSGLGLVFSPEGHLLYYRDFGFNTQDFRPHVVGEQIFYSVLRVTRVHDGINVEGHRLIFDHDFNFITELPDSMDGHDFILQSLTNYIFTRYRFDETKSGQCTLNQEVVERRGESLDIIASDSLMKFPQNLFRQVQVEGKLCSFIGHLNSLQVLDRSHLLIGMSAAGIFSWNKELKTPDWIFSGPLDQFGLKSELQPILQHTPVWDSSTNTLVFFDNFRDGKSQVQLYKLNLVHHQILSSERIAIGNALAAFGGSVFSDEKQSVFSVGFGSRKAGHWDFVEVDHGKETMKLRFSKMGQDYIYRFYRGVSEVN